MTYIIIINAEKKWKLMKNCLIRKNFTKIVKNFITAKNRTSKKKDAKSTAAITLSTSVINTVVA